MDAYNRGYDAGINDAGQGDLDGLGNADTEPKSELATITRASDPNDPNRADVAAGFYALSYDTQYGQVISYRGTDNVDPFTWNHGASDLWTGWVFGAGPVTSQIKLAQAFYEAATGADVFSSDGNAILTGHSLGGGLAGPVISAEGLLWGCGQPAGTRVIRSALPCGTVPSDRPRAGRRNG
jgi:hypothetical protein